MSLLAHDPDESPWFAALVASPEEETGRFLSGAADIGAFRAAEVRDAAWALFGGLPKLHQARVALDLGLVTWLEKARRGGFAFAKTRLAFEAGEAIAVAGRLGLLKTVRSLRSELADFVDWSTAISSPQKFDVLSELYSALALTQSAYAKEEDSSGAFDLQPLWFGLCEGAGSIYPAHYLNIGLLGLRFLPERVDQANDRLWLLGLARWAKAQEPDVARFGFQWRSLKALYPRAKAYWKKQLSYVLRNISLPLVISDFWRREIGLTDEVSAELPPDPAWKAISSPDVLATLIQRLDEALHQIEQPIRREIAARIRYAEVTGSSYFLTTTCCNIGMRLLDAASDDEIIARGRLAAELARVTLKWSPDDVFGWALWRDALEAQGLTEAAELVGWETIRRYPENPQWRSQLALLLIRTGRSDEAETVLIETRRRFPHELVATSILAELSLSQGQLAQAGRYLDEALALPNPTTPIYSAKSRLLFHTEGAAAAIDILDRGLRAHPGAPDLQGYRDSIAKEGVVPPLVTATFKLAASSAKKSPSVQSAVVLPNAARRGGILSRIAFRTHQEQDADWREFASKEVQDILEEAPNNEYGLFLESQLSGRSSVNDTFAIKLAAAIERADKVQLRELSSMFPQRKAIIDAFCGVLLNDDAAMNDAFAWLASERQSETRSESALRGFILGRMGEAGIFAVRDARPVDIRRLLAANDNFRIDVIEAALAPNSLLIAA